MLMWLLSVLCGARVLLAFFCKKIYHVAFDVQ